MSFGRGNVDYGPIALPVGAIQEAKASAPRAGDLEADASRLQNILSNVNGKRGAPEFDRDSPMMGGDGRGKSEEIPNEMALGLELERLWICNGSGGIREVRLRLADTLIPDTWVHIYKHGGELQIELSAALDGTRQWLGRSSTKLADDIGSRLQCPVRVTVHGANGTEATCAAFMWEGSPST
jgi:hypothetical protein